MIVKCPKCKKEYHFEERHLSKGPIKVRCRTCKHIWIIGKELENFKSSSEGKGALRDVKNQVREPNDTVAYNNELMKISDIEVEKPIEPVKDDDVNLELEVAKFFGESENVTDIESLVEALKDYSADIRSEAAKDLGEIGDERAVEPLIEALRDDDDEDVRSEVARSLGEIGDERAIDSLLEVLNDDYSDVRKCAEEALDKIRDARGIDWLTEAVKHGDKNVRLGATEVLGKIGDERAVEPLIEALKDESVYVRERAAEALGKIGNSKAIEPLIKAFGNNYSKIVRESILEALGELGDQRALGPLIESIKDFDEDVRESAAEALGKIGDERAVEPLIEALKDESVYVRERAAEALGKIGNSKAIEPLIKALKDYYVNVRVGAVEALGKTRDERAVESLIDALRDEEEDVRDSAAETLGKTKDGRVVQPLIEALYNDDSNIRSEAAKELAKIGDERAVEPLIEAFKNYYESFRSEVIGDFGERKEAGVIELSQTQEAAYTTHKEKVDIRGTWKYKSSEELDFFHYLRKLINPQQHIPKELWHSWTQRLSTSNLCKNRIEDIATDLGLLWPGSRIKEKLSDYLHLDLTQIRNLTGLGEKKIRTIVLCIAKAAIDAKEHDYRKQYEQKIGKIVRVKQPYRKSIEEKVDLNQIFTKLLDSLNERDREILKRRFVDGKTLEAVGIEFNLTRERVRQVLAKLSRRLRHPRNHLKKELNTFLIENQKFASFSKFLDKYRIIEQEKRQFLYSLFDYTFKEDFVFFNGYITNKEFENIFSKAKETINEQIQEIGLPFDKSKLFQSVKEKSEVKGLPISYDLLDFWLSKEGLILDSNNPKLVVYISKFSLPDNLALILKNHKEPIHFADLAKHITKMIRKEVTPHNLEARMRGDKRFILVDAGKFILFRNYGVFLKAKTGLSGEELKDLIVNIIKKSSRILEDGEDFTDTNFLLSRLKQEMSMPEIITPYALKELLLRYAYFEGGRKFEIRRVKKGEREKESKGRREYADLIWEVLYEAKGSLHIEKIQNRLRGKSREIPMSTLNMILSNNERFIRVDQSTYTIPQNLDLTKDDIFFIKSRAYQSIKLRKEPISSIFLIQQLIQHSEKYNVLNCQAIYSILKKDSRFIDLAPSFFAIKENLPSQIKSLKDYVRQTLKEENMPLASDHLIKILNNKLGYFDKGNLNTVIGWDKDHIVRNYGFVYLREWDIAKVLPEIFEKGEKRIRKEIEKFIEIPGQKNISLDQLFIWLRFCMWSWDAGKAKKLVRIINRFKPEGPEKEYLDKVKSKLDI